MLKQNSVLDYSVFNNRETTNATSCKVNASKHTFLAKDVINFLITSIVNKKSLHHSLR
jgi:hypothetical protein